MKFALLAAYAAAKDLRFNDKGKFKFVQFTDTHFGESDKKDSENQRLMGDILDQEKPDFVVFTGDVNSAYESHEPGWVATYWTKAVQPMVDRGLNWAVTLGNHDAQGDLTRDQVSEFDRSFDLSMTLPNQGNISHTTNYVLPVYGQTGEDVQIRLWFLDTGDSDCLNVPGYGCVMPD